MADLSVPFVDEQAMKGMAEGKAEVRIAKATHCIGSDRCSGPVRHGRLCFLPAGPQTVT